MKIRTRLACTAALILCLFFVGCLEYTPAPMSFDTFKDTPVWELAKAVRSNNLKKIRELVLEDNANINYQEGLYGYTVLMTALCNGKKMLFYDWVKPETIELLLQLGADPNIYGDKEGQRGENPVLIASREGHYDGLRLLLEYGGDPNSQTRKLTGRFQNDGTAMIEVACSLVDDDTKIKCMEMLLKAGADINARTDRCIGGVLQDSLFKFKIIKFLLDNGVDPNTQIYYYGSTKKIMPFPEVMRYSICPLDSEEYKWKLEVIEILKEIGIDYYSTPIPDSCLDTIKERYPDTWEDYIKVY